MQPTVEIRQLPSEVFWPIFKANRAQYFEDTFYFSSMALRTEHELASHPSLYNGYKNRFELNLGLYINDELSGWCTSVQTHVYELYMMNSVIFPEHRRQGHYSALMKETIRVAREKGFMMVTSNHICSNNAVIIPKLKEGFKINGLEVMDDFGTVVKLVLHLNEKRAEALEFRTGMLKPNESIRRTFNF